MAKLCLSVVGVAAAIAPPCYAQQAGDWQIGAGWFHIVPQDSSKPLVLTSPVMATLPGSGADVQSSDTVGLNLTYFIDGNWAVEGVMGVPPRFKLNGTGTLEPAAELGSARQWSPTLLVKHYFNDSTAKLRPFVGVGATYTWYTDVEVSANMQAVFAGLLNVPPSALTTSAKLGASFAPVFNLGLAYQFDPRWGIVFSVSYIPIKTKAKLTTSVGSGAIVTSEASLKVNPLVPYLSVTYKF